MIHLKQKVLNPNVYEQDLGMTFGGPLYSHDMGYPIPWALLQ